jgi:methylthioribose-1-phosphate isomerase
MSSTASSSTDDAPRLRRREFFRQLGEQGLRGAGQLAGAVGALRETSAQAASELFDGGQPAPPLSAAPRTEPGFRSAYLYEDGALRLLDARQLPERNSEVVCHDSSEVAAAIRAGVVSAGPVLAEIAAYTLAMTAQRTAGRPEQARHQHWQATANTLRAARGFVHAVVPAIERMDLAQHQQADAREAADALATDQATAHARLARLCADALLASLAVADDGPLNVLIHGDMGSLSCGALGTGVGVLSALQSVGRPVHAWLPEGAPSLAGQRIGALQLGRAEIAHTVLPDSAVGWLLTHRHIDAVLLRGDWICANRDTAAVLGSATIAGLARANAVPVYVCATSASFDPASADGSALPVDPNPSAIVDRLNPPADLVPAADITGFLTEAGLR